jgi:predicted RNA-binding Zn ribbon-like protein
MVMVNTIYTAIAVMPAPGQLGFVEAFVNTIDLEDGRDRIDSPEKLAGWLTEQELADVPGVDAAGHRRAIELREALRALLAANNGEAVDAGAVETVNRIAGRAPLVLRLESNAAGRLEPLGSDLDAALARLLAIVARAQADGSWERMKACSAHDCRWAFYDHSRNHSRSWCSMRVCGNRAKARSYRERSARRD